MVAMLTRPTLLLNRHWQPVGVAPVARSLTLVAAERARIVDPATFQQYTWEDWAELIPGYMHVRIQSDLLVSEKAQPGNDVVERRTPYYVYLKPHGANDEDIKARSKSTRTPPIFIPMPPH